MRRTRMMLTRKIYVQFKKPKTVRAFLKSFFLGGNTMYYSVITYEDKECKRQQCGPNRMRSFDDIFDCVKTYFPAVSEKRVLHELLTAGYSNGGHPLEVALTTCSTMNKIRVVYYPGVPKCHFEHSRMVNSRYNWKQLLGLLEIKNQQDLEKYVKDHRKTT